MKKRILISIMMLTFVGATLVGCSVPKSALPVETVAEKYIVEKDAGRYLGHPDSVLLANGDILTVYPQGHGRGNIIMQKSKDFGRTWTKQATPASWADSQETPTIYPLILNDGSRKLVLISGRPGWGDLGEGFDCSVSTNEGATFSEFARFYEGFKGIVAMSSLTQLKENDVFVEKWMGTFHDYDFVNYATTLTFDDGGNPQWSYPRRLFKEHRDIEKTTAMCEIETIRSPDGAELMMIARANNKVSYSMVTVSTDEGESWLPPRELSAELTGDRHKAEYDPISGKLLISFRGVGFKNSIKNNKNCVAKDWVGWVGTYADLRSYCDDDKNNDKLGEKRILFASDYGKGDCGYSGVVVNSEGLFSLISYGKFDRKVRYPYIVALNYKI